MLTGQEWFKGVDSSGPISQTGTAGIGAIQTRRPARTPASSAVPKVRIRFPPAASQQRTRFGPANISNWRCGGDLRALLCVDIGANGLALDGRQGDVHGAAADPARADDSVLRRC